MAVDLDTLNHLIDTVRRFVENRLIPLEAQVAEDDCIPDHIINEMRDHDVFKAAFDIDKLKITDGAHEASC